MNGSYNAPLVALSLFVAIIASYTALELAGRVSQKRGKSSWFWLVGGAFAMGSGIWSMHFIAMLAFHLPVPIAYDAWITILSLVIGIVASGLALYVVRRPTLTGANITAGATLMGVGISAMHYTGMYAMSMSPPIEYQPFMFMASVVIAIGASFVALWIAYRLRHTGFGVAFTAKIGSAAIMGLAITGMHYSAMAAAEFAPDSICLAVDSTHGMPPGTLAVTIGIATLAILTITLALSALDAHTAKLSVSLRAANEELLNLALYDNLTGLPNRALLDDRLAQAAVSATRTRQFFALMFIDLDHFKAVNDNFGHGVGDELLRTVAKRLASCVRKADTVTRLGGDEFVVLLKDIADPGNAALVGSKILEELSRPFIIERHELNISASMGIAVYPHDGSDVQVLKAHADTAMYQAKRNGRNSFRFFTLEVAAATQK